MQNDHPEGTKRHEKGTRKTKIQILYPFRSDPRVSKMVRENKFRVWNPRLDNKIESFSHKGEN